MTETFWESFDHPVPQPARTHAVSPRETRPHVAPGKRRARRACSRALAVLWLAALCLPGCGGPETAPRGTVAGKVTLGGKPVTRGAVVFENPETGVAVMAALGPDGTYEVKTYEGAGLPVGHYRVAVTPQAPAATDENPLAGAGALEPPQPVEIPARYHDAADSPLEIDVDEGKNRPFDFELEP